MKKSIKKSILISRINERILFLDKFLLPRKAGSEVYSLVCDEISYLRFVLRYKSSYPSLKKSLYNRYVFFMNRRCLSDVHESCYWFYHCINSSL